jgi:hypothetical protein
MNPYVKPWGVTLRYSSGIALSSRRLCDVPFLRLPFPGRLLFVMSLFPVVVHLHLPKHRLPSRQGKVALRQASGTECSLTPQQVSVGGGCRSTSAIRARSLEASAGAPYPRDNRL